MPIKLSNSLNGLAAIKKIGVPQDTYDWLAASPVKVTLTAKEFLFTVPTSKGPVYYKVAVQLDHLQKLAMGNLPTALKVQLGQQLTNEIGEIKSWWGKELYQMQEDLVDKLFEDLSPPASVLAQLPPIASLTPETKQELKEAAVKTNVPWPAFDTKKIKTAPPVKLRDATMLYQPVHGTSHGSRYYMVAANKDIRVACRLHAGTLSVRIEGPGFDKHVSAMNESGLTAHPSKGYASVHLTVGSLTLARKTLGAVLMGLGIPLETPLPELEKVAE